MKYTAVAILATAALAAAVPSGMNYGTPKGDGWESITYKQQDANDNFDTCLPVAAGVFAFTSTYVVHATPDQVVASTPMTRRVRDSGVFPRQMNNGTRRTGGLPGSQGIFAFGINVDLDTICYNITIFNFEGEYQSPAKTATHIHEARVNATGPPRLAFPNPEGEGEIRRSVGCLVGPFTTGLMMNGVDTGEGFTLRQIEENPAGFFTDVHSSLAVPGAMRGQLG
ncbi:hypothetical protein M8818_006252 [Zalaria obscura]|uniref:Uncharacterized protein n=1 Tax=Zalaria obscura TaxID=2024903 RepID=A0ACC3S7D1_9PEZI